MKIFIICPVRLGEVGDIYQYIEYLESQGHIVHYPPRDTDQVDLETGGYRICMDNAMAIAESHEVHIWYRGDSQGIHFDLGLAFAMGKKIKILNHSQLLDHMPEGYSKDAPKSFPKMMEYWEKNDNS